MLKGLKEPCKRYDTKPENVPINLIGAINTAEELRELKELALLPALAKLTAYEFECYRIAEGASRTIEAEYYKEMSEQQKNSSNTSTFNGKETDSSQSAFGSW